MIEKVKEIMSEISVAQIKWSLRRLYWGLPKKFLVLEVGSGGNPCPRSDILVDYSTGEHEKSRGLVSDRPVFLCAGEELPFTDKQFDFVISFHNLEHSKNPRKFLNEMQRVAKAGYIETPSSAHEVLFPYKFHSSLIWKDNDKLHIKMKSHWDDPLRVDLSKSLMTNLTATKEFIGFYRNNPRVFNTSFYWNDNINFEIHNEGISQSWEDSDKYQEYAHQLAGNSIKSKLRNIIPRYIRKIMGYSKRNVDILSLLKCVACSETNYKKIENKDSVDFVCKSCGSIVSQKYNFFHSNEFTTLGKEQ